MPDIYDIETIHTDSGCTVVIVKFSDCTSEKFVVCDNDAYPFEEAISVCLLKKLLSMKGYHGTALLHKIVDRCIGIYEEKMKEAEQKEQEKRLQEEKRKKIKEKRRKKRARKEEEKRNSQIELYKEAILRAMKEQK